MHSRSNNLQVAIGCAFGLVVLGSDLLGRYAPIDIVDVPVERLVANIEEILRRTPDDPIRRVNLARTHMMAYASKSPTIAANRASTAPSIEPEQENVMPTVATASNDVVRRTAEQHLNAAIQQFETAIQLAPTLGYARLGYAWALEQSGDRVKAIAAYRVAIDVAWPTESDPRVSMMGWRTVTDEAARYLIPLLDPIRDATEIADLNAKQSRLAGMARGITPLIVPLHEGARVEDLVDLSASVQFDADGSGLPQRWTWVTPAAGWLVFNPNHRPVTSALQLFGNVTFWLFWGNGYEALQSLDDDGNGRLTGKELAGIDIWRDVNSDAISDPGELRSLADWHIRELSVASEAMDFGEERIAFSPSGVTFDDGTTRPTYDVLLHRRH